MKPTTLFSKTPLIARVIFILSLFLLFACQEKPATAVTLSGFTMGTNYNVTVVTSISEEEQQKVKQLIDQRLESLNDLMSTYVDYSELSIINKLPPGQWAEISPELLDIVGLSLELSWLSNGAFDITVGSLVNLWGFGPDPRQTEAPADEAIVAEKVDVGYTQLELNFEDDQILKKTDLKLDLSAIGKGYAVDEVAELLNAAGFNNFMVEIGGEIKTQGLSPRGGPWRIAVEKPGNNVGMVQQVLSLDGVAVATSGDYRNYFEADGKRYSHTIDPRTGYPITHNLASVTVVNDSAAYADGLATAFSVMGPEQAMALAQAQQLAVYMLLKNETGFEVQFSPAFEQYLAK